MKQIEGHTIQRYDGELTELHVLLVEMGGLVTDQLFQALESLRIKDTELAVAVLDRDNDVDALESQVDAEVESILARRTPVAVDLRTVIACSKSVTDLERIGDEANKIARVTLQTYDSDSNTPNDRLLRDVFRMGEVAKGCLREAIEVLDTFDEATAERIISADNLLNEEFQDATRRIATFLMEDSRNVGHAIRVILALKALERIGDHSKNIAEHVIYLVRGEDVRHRRE